MIGTATQAPAGGGCRPAKAANARMTSLLGKGFLHQRANLEFGVDLAAPHSAIEN